MSASNPFSTPEGDFSTRRAGRAQTETASSSFSECQRTRKGFGSWEVVLAPVSRSWKPTR